MIIDSRIVILTDSNFKKSLQNHSNKLFLVDFWAEWCSPCKTLAPIFEEVSTEYNDDKVIFGKLNVDGNSLTIKEYSIRSIPTLLLFFNNIMISSKIGVLSKKELKEFLDSNLRF